MAVLALGATACEIDPAEFRFGEQLGSLEFNLYSETMGIHPFADVLADPNNPFARSVPSQKDAFAILETASAAAGFYAFASRLATVEPTGLSQFYSARQLEVIFATEQVPPEQLATVRDMAVAGYEAQLLFFPDDVQFLDESATDSFRLATDAYLGIVRLTGIAPPGWTLVQTEGGGLEAVR